MAASGLLTGIAWWTKYTGWLPRRLSATGSLVAARRFGEIPSL
ncbi:MAG: hypothetical protein R3C49_06455 [Planctomycetaceae bacterium]